MKQTEIDGVADTLIPDDWEVKRLGEIGEPCMCKRILKEQTSPTGDIPFYKIGTFGGIPDAYISRELFEQYKEQYNYPKKGTLLLSAAGTIGRVVVFDGKDSYFQDSNIVWIDNDETKVTNDFLFYCYSRMQWKTEEGGIVSRLYNANLKSTSFIAPKSLAEQERIAKALSDVDALISTTEKLIQKKKNIKQGAMQNLLTGKKRLPGFGPQTKSPTYKQTELGLIPEDWEVKSLGESFDIGSSKRVFQSQWRKSGIPFYRAREIVILAEKNTVENELFIDETLYNQYKTLYGVPAVNDLLVTGVGTLGKVYKVQNTNPFYFKDGNIICLKNKGSINSDYVSYHFDYYIVKDQINDNSGKSTVGTYTINSARKTIIPVPSVPEQTAIANVLSSMDKEIETLNTNLEKYRNLKTAMMQQLLTGKIRLVK